VSLVICKYSKFAKFAAITVTAIADYARTEDNVAIVDELAGTKPRRPATNLS